MDTWNSKLYDRKHSFVSQLGQPILELLAPKEGEQILDLGCGTGDLSYELAKRGAHVVGVDQSEAMIEEAKRKYPKLTFKVEDILHLKETQRFDAVFSNAVLHWVQSPQKALDSIYRSLKPNGRFVAEFGGEGNVELITLEVKRQMEELDLLYEESRFPWYFPSIGRYTVRMEEAGFRVTFAKLYDRPTPLDGENGMENWLRMFGQALFSGLDKETKETLVYKTVQALRNTLYSGQRWVADYKRLQVIGSK